MTLTTLMRGPGSGSFDPNTRLTAQTAKEEINPFPRKEEIELVFFFFQRLFLHFWFPLHVGSYFPGGSDGKESACNAVVLGSIPGLGRYPEKGTGNLPQYSCLENSMDRGVWQAIVHGIAKSQI